MNGTIHKTNIKSIIQGGYIMKIDVITKSSEKNYSNNNVATEVVKVGNYECERTNTPNVFKVLSHRGGYLARCNYGKVEKISKKDGTKKVVNELTYKIVPSKTEAKRLVTEADNIRLQKKQGIIPVTQTAIKEKVTLKNVIDDFKQDKFYLELSGNYQLHYDNYCNHILDFMAHKEPKDITVSDIEEYYQYQLTRGNLSTAKRNKDGNISKKEVTENNPKGLSVNTIAKHKTALKNIWKFMLKKGVYGVENNVVLYSEIPKVEIEVDGKVIKTRHIQPVQNVLNMEQLNYTLNDAIQNEADRSIAVMIALASIGGLRRSEVAALKIGRYYHDERIKIGVDMWNLNDFVNTKDYYIQHDELILIDEAITHNKTDVLGFPKENIIRMVGKPNCLNEIIEYSMEQRKQMCDIMGVDITSDDKIYMPLRNVIQQVDFTSQKISRKWKEYQQRRNNRMEKLGLEPIPIIKLHELRHTHASLLSEEVVAKKISRNMGHVVPGEGHLYNTTTKVYIHDREPDRSEIIAFWDKHIKIDWDKALRVNLNDSDNRAHVNGSGHLVIMDEDKKRIMEIRKRYVITEEEEAELLYSKR